MHTRETHRGWLPRCLLLDTLFSASVMFHVLFKNHRTVLQVELVSFQDGKTWFAFEVELDGEVRRNVRADAFDFLIEFERVGRKRFDFHHQHDGQWVKSLAVVRMFCVKSIPADLIPHVPYCTANFFEISKNSKIFQKKNIFEKYF